jgi:hypothetical protein
MIEEKFEELAEKYEGRYTFHEIEHRGPGLRKFSVEYYQLKLEYMACPIHIKFEFGNFNLAHVTCVLDAKRSFPDFQIERMGHFIQLFKRGKQPWKVHVKDPMLEQKLLHLLTASGLDEVARKTAFEPEISGKREAAEYTLNTRFYLGFDDKEHSAQPLIEFYRGVIDLAL